jgi:hypothetical protein
VDVLALYDIHGNVEALDRRAVGEAVGAPEPSPDDLAGVLFCHASPRRDDEMLTRLSAAEGDGAARWLWVAGGSG